MILRTLGLIVLLVLSVAFTASADETFGSPFELWLQLYLRLLGAIIAIHYGIVAVFSLKLIRTMLEAGFRGN